MQLQRNYTLPNCTLILEGMSDPNAGITPGAPMTILVNAVCQFLGKNQPLSGGLEFFSSLVATTSSYAQEQLSGIRSQVSQQGLVQMRRLESGLHQVAVHQSSPEHSSGQDAVQTTELSTVQLFDLVEAIDQFLADNTALPQLKWAIAPLAKRDVPSQQSVAQRTAAPALGVAGLAIAAAALFAVPLPEITRPLDGKQGQIEATTKKDGDEAAKTADSEKDLSQDSDQDADQDSGQDSGQAIPAPSPENLITDELVLGAIGADLENSINEVWKEPLGADSDLVYRVSTSEDGTILGYEGIDAISKEYASKTPLLDKLYIPAEGGSVVDQPLAKFKVTFTAEDQLKVEPFSMADLAAARAAQEQASLTEGKAEAAAETETAAKDPDKQQDKAASSDKDSAKETDKAAIAAKPQTGSQPTGLVTAEPLKDASTIDGLNEQLYDQIDENWTESPSFDGSLSYRVQVDSSGEVVGFEALNEDGKQYLGDVPLGTMKQSAQPDQVAEFKVVFKSSGVLEVSPWDGF